MPTNPRHLLHRIQSVQLLATYQHTCHITYDCVDPLLDYSTVDPWQMDPSTLGPTHQAHPLRLPVAQRQVELSTGLRA